MNIDIGQHIQSIIYLLYSGIVLVFLGLANFEFTGKSRLSLLLIALGSFSMAMFVALSDPFLHMWDEQVHAVVAKNMMDHPFKPMLMANPVLHYDYKNWTGNNVWVHKQPLFLWQIALSLKIFGTNILSLRLPSILMTALLAFPVYRIGKIISGKRTGIYAAALLAASNFIYQLVSGRMHTDHNDVAFLFYVTLSIWAWFEKENSEKKYWIILIGLFAGMAILNKWLVGLLVYSVWGINTLVQKERRSSLSSYLEIIASLVVTVIVALPWQIYIFNNFPMESKFEFEYNSLHFFQALEGHKGDYFYHFNKFESLFGTDFQYVFLVAVVVLIFSRIKTKYKISVLSPIVIVYLFYSLAATKMPAFPIIVAPIVYLVVAVAISFLLQLLKTTKLNGAAIKFIGLSFMFFMFFHFLNHGSLALKNKAANLKTYQNATNSTMVYKSLTKIFKDKEVIVYNSRNYDKLKIMFHTCYRARSGVPSKKNIGILRENNIDIAVFDNNKLPAYILNDTTIAKIRSLVWQKNFGGDIELYY